MMRFMTSLVILIAASTASAQTSASDAGPLPSLYVLSIGINAYKGELALKCATPDAKVMNEVLGGPLSKRLYKSVQTRLLTDEKATRREILLGMSWLRKEMTQRDVGVIFFAGHGAKDASGRYFLVPVDGDPTNLAATGLSEFDLKTALDGLPGRKLLLLDACYAGAAGLQRTRAASAVRETLIKDLANDDRGVVLMCGAMAREESAEAEKLGHGFFTQSLIEGLRGRADYNKDGVVYLTELDHYVTDRVKELSRGEQHAVTAKPTSIRSFPLTHRLDAVATTEPIKALEWGKNGQTWGPEKAQHSLMIPGTQGVAVSAIGDWIGIPNYRGQSVLVAGEKLGFLSPSNGKEMIPPLEGPTRYSTVAFSPDGLQIAVGRATQTYRRDKKVYDQPGEVYVYVKGMSPTEKTWSRPGNIQLVSWSSDSKFLAVKEPTQVTVYEAATGKVLRTITGLDAPVPAVAVGLAGHRLLTGGDGIVKFWDLGTGRQIWEIRSESGQVQGVAFGGDDGISRVAVVWDKEIVVYETATRRVIWRRVREMNWGGGVVVNISRRVLLCAGAKVGQVVLLDLYQGTEILTLAAHSGPIQAISLGQQGRRLATVGIDGQVRIWLLPVNAVGDAPTVAKPGA